MRINKTVNTQTGEVTTRQVEEPPIPIETIQAQKLNELRQIVAEVRANGMPFSFEGLNYHMQTGLDDINNWTSALTRLYRMTDKTVTHWVRPKENTTIYPTVEKCIELMEQAQDYHYALLISNGTIKDTINAQTDKATLEAMDVKETFKQTLQSLISQA